MTNTWTDTPFTRAAAKSLPLLIEAHGILYPLAAPEASRVSHEIALLMERIIDLAGTVEAYGNKWCGGRTGELAEKLREATREYNSI